MKHITLLLSLLLVPFLGQATQVDPATARTIGEHFLQRTSARSGDNTPIALDLAWRVTSAGINPANMEGVSTYYYVFNTHDAPGFIIVAGDDAVTPVLGYSDRNDYDPTHLPENMAKWIEGYTSVIAEAVAINAAADEDVQARWETLLQPAAETRDDGDRSVNPLLQTTWSQSPNYNALCPGGSVTGCVATAMAQVMKFWNYPATGTGFHSYDHPQYGTLSANFATTTFDWGSMPNSISGPNSAIATLMYAAGVSVDMVYSPQVSNAYVITAQSPIQNCAEYALKTYFGYDPGLQGVQRANYSDPAWVNLLKNELDNGRPIIYAGFGTGGGHCFDFDGYDNSDMFHVNWGWAGSYNGYFAVSGMDPAGVGTGGGDGGYNSGQQAVIGIHSPGGGTQIADMQLYDYVVPSPNPIYYGQAFDVVTNILNNSTSTFNGDYCAALFDAQGTFVDYVQIISGESLPAGYVYDPPGVTFSNAGNFAYLPGNYSIGVFFRPTGGNWQQVADANSYTNMVPFSIINPNNIEMYTAMDVTSGLPMTTGASTTVSMKVANYSANDITATFDLSLYNLDGSYAQEIASLAGQSVPAGFWIGPMTFSNTVSMAPGSYLLALTYSTDNTNYQLVGSTDFSNPILVTVQSAGLQPDIYEANNTFPTSYQFTPNYTGNAANVNTNGSNCHNGSDDDFYKFDLPAGYDYTINARLHDSHNSGNGNTYTVDALFSFTTDGVNWSSTYDDVTPGSFVVNGGTVIHFHVAPYFLGQTGTYLLNADITRSPSSGISTDPAITDGFQLYPDPTTDRLNIDLSGLAESATSLSIMNAQGQQVRNIIPASGIALMTVDVNALAKGAYYVQVRTASGVGTRSFIKAE